MSDNEEILNLFFKNELEENNGSSSELSSDESPDQTLITSLEKSNYQADDADETDDVAEPVIEPEPAADDDDADEPTAEPELVDIVLDSEQMSMINALIKNLNGDLVPESYKKISKRFPHLNQKEIIDFDNAVRNAGGSIQVHSGRFETSTRNYQYTDKGSNKFTYPVWSCCHNVIYPQPGKTVPYMCVGRDIQPLDGKLTSVNISIPGMSIKGAIDLFNRYPDGRCDHAETFKLYENDKLTNVDVDGIKQLLEKIKDNVDSLTNVISKHQNKIGKLNKITETFELLLDLYQ